MSPLFLIVFFLLVPAASFAQEIGGSEIFPEKAILNASYAGDAALVKRILAAGTNIDTRDSTGATALHIATFQHNVEVFKHLLDYGFDINAVIPSSGLTPLHYCVLTNNTIAAKFLLSNHADKTLKDKNGHTPLEQAIKGGKREMIMELSRNDSHRH